MIIKYTDNKIEYIQPEEGYMLHKEDVYSDLVYLSNIDSPENWTEVAIEDIPDSEEVIPEEQS